MDGENHGKPYEQMDDLGGFTTPILGNTHVAKTRDRKSSGFLGCKHGNIQVPGKFLKVTGGRVLAGNL